MKLTLEYLATLKVKMPILGDVYELKYAFEEVFRFEGNVSSIERKFTIREKNPENFYQRKGDLSICFVERTLIYINYYYKRTDMQEYLHNIVEFSRGYKGNAFFFARKHRKFTNDIIDGKRTRTTMFLHCSYSSVSTISLSEIRLNTELLSDYTNKLRRKHNIYFLTISYHVQPTS